MKIRFEITIDDIVAFNRFHCENSPTWRRQHLLLSLLLPGVVVLASLLMVILAIGSREAHAFRYLVSAVVLVLSAGVISVPWFFFLRWRLLASMSSAVRRLLAEGTNRCVLGWREMELVNNRLVVKLELVHSSYDLRAIEKIVANEEFTFVYVSSMQALLIPMTLYPEEEYREFVADLTEAWDHRDAPMPVEEPDERDRSVDARITEKPL